MSQVAILGATGRLGRRLIAAAIDKGYRVKALARDPLKIRSANESLTVFEGDAESGEGLDVVVRGCRFVISALGSTRPVMTKCVANLLPQLNNGVLERFVFISWMGVGDSAAQHAGERGWRLLQRFARKAMFADIGRAEGIVRMSRLPYVILRPTLLTDGHLTRQVAAVSAQEAPPGRISRADLAWFVLKILEEPGWERAEATVGAAG